MLSLMSSLFDGWFGYGATFLRVHFTQLIVDLQVHFLGHGLPNPLSRCEEVGWNPAQFRDYPKLRDHSLRLLYPRCRNLCEHFALPIQGVLWLTSRFCTDID